MPTYEYRCENGHTFEVFQKMADDPVSVCTECGAPVERVLHPIAVHFKGTGFYSTDYGSNAKSKAAAAESGDPKSSSSEGDSKSSDGGGESKSSGSGDSTKSAGDSSKKSDSSGSGSKDSTKSSKPAKASSGGSD